VLAALLAQTAPAAPVVDDGLQDGPWKLTNFSRGYPEVAKGWRRKRQKDDDLVILH
jgi:hypothetical protein